MQGEKLYGIKEVTGRKRTWERQVSGHNPEEWVKTWLERFQRLLGETVVGGVGDVPAFLQNLDIDNQGLCPDKGGKRTFTQTS